MIWRPQLGQLILASATLFAATTADASDSEPTEPTVAVAEAPTVAKAGIPVELSAELSAMTRYVWRGMALSHSAASSFLVELGVGPCSADSALVQPWFDVDGSPTPIEFYASAKCSFALGAGFSIAPLAEYWLFPAADIWQAGYFGVELAYSVGDFTVATEQAVMVGDAENAYYGEVSLAWSDAFGPIEVSAHTSLGWGDRTFMRTMQEVGGAGGLNQIDATLDVAWAFAAHMSLFIAGHIAGLLTDALHAKEDTSVLGAGLMGLRGSVEL